MKSIRTWIVIADAAHLRIFENTGPGKGLTHVPAHDRDQDLPASRDLGDDRPGRSHQSVGDSRSAMEPTSDPHREAKRRFAHDIADLLHTQLVAKAFDRLVVVAPPVTLGDLRTALAADVAKVVMADLAKDLTKTPTTELPRHLADVIAL